MRRLQEVAQDREDMAKIVQLTSAFEGLASMHISKIRNQVLRAQQFFDELWSIYSQLRIDNLFRFGRQQADAPIKKDLYMIISASGGFSGDIDQRLIKTMLESYDKTKQDIIVVGHHGAILLTQANISFKKYFKLPESDNNINVEPLAREIRQYHSTIVFYQAYTSLMVQEIRKIELSSAVKALGDSSIGQSNEFISEQTYIFEPSTFAVIAHLERSMLQIALSQVVLDSKLAQYASRFRAMSSAKDIATESLYDLKLLYNRSQRSLHDEQLKQIISGLQLSGRHQ